jgi:SAM-dependent methyltransferase
MQQLTKVTEISRIAYGFMASKVLFAALDLDLFTRLAVGPKSLSSLVGESGIAENRLLTLLTACTSLGMLVKSESGYANAPASQTYLVQGSPACYADYFRYQTDRQIYPSFQDLNAALRGAPTQRFYAFTEDDALSEQFSRAQHTGSLGPAYLFAKRYDLSDVRCLLDVAGGSGAFSLTLCKRNPAMHATILDFPNMTRVARRYASEVGLADRISLVSGNAFEIEWPRDQDAVLISYLMYCVDGSRIPELMLRAYDSLRPGGRLFVHDFMVEDDGNGPSLAALWLVSSLLADPDAVLLTPGTLSERAREAGFAKIEVQELIPEITKVLAASKPR